MPQILLKHGIALVHKTDDHVEAVRTDILIDGNRVSKIAPDISEPQAEVHVIDCTDKIISPGFVDTHHHVWQSQLRGTHADQTLLNYLPCGNFVAKFFSPEDAFWGQLGGCLEMIDGGTTTVADFAQLNITREHNLKAISATAATGLRSVYGYSLNPQLSSVDPFIIDSSGPGEHGMPTFEELAQTTPWGDGRVVLGFAWDGFAFRSKEQVDVVMRKVNEYGVRLIQTHTTWRPWKPSVPQIIEGRGYLDHRFLLSHSNMSREDADLYRKRGVHYSSTPSSEQQMAMGFPVMSFRDDLGVKDLGSLGADVHSNNAAYLPGEARIGLQGARAARGEIAAKQGKTPLTVGYSVEEAFNLATIRGAHAMKMADQIGSIAQGKFADLVIFDALSPAMVCAGVQDPVAAIILHSSPADVDTVIIDGIVRKRDGKLEDIKLDDDEGRDIAGKDLLTWPDVARNLIRSRARIKAQAAKIDMAAAEKKVMEAFHISESELGDP